MSAPGTDRGVVLLNALVIISVVAAIAASLIRDDLEARNRYELMLRSDQARVYARAAEALTMRLLALDSDANEIDHLGEAWAEGDRTFDIEGATLTGRIYDLQGRLNLNQLLQYSEPEEGAKAELLVSTPDLTLLNALVQNAGGPATLGPRMAEWISPDILDLPGAAGDAPYLRGAVPILRPARAAIAPRDFRPVDGMSADTYRALSAAITALPEPTAINVNTAPRPVLQAMMPGLRATQLDRLIQHRQQNPFQTRAAFQDYVADILAPRTLQELSALNLDVKSNWFLLEVNVVHGISRARLYSVIKRPDGGSTPSIVLRSGAAL
jgi:general secretion pathway protein K